MRARIDAEKKTTRCQTLTWLSGSPALSVPHFVDGDETRLEQVGPLTKFHIHMSDEDSFGPTTQNFVPRTGSASLNPLRKGWRPGAIGYLLISNHFLTPKSASN
jgi:hypothetical protein